MPRFDTNSWLAAAERYALLRRRYWRRYLSGVGFAVGFGVAFGAILRHDLSQPVRSAAMGIFAAAMLFWMIMTFLAWLALVRFRCPRCGNRLGVIGYRWRCGSCGLELEAAARAREH